MTTIPVRLIGAGMVLAGLGAGWIGVDGLGRMARDWSNDATVLTVSTGAAAALPVGLILLIAAKMMLAPIARDNDQLLRRHFGMILALVPAILLLPLLLFGASDLLLPKAGYTRCPHVRPARFVAIDWYRGNSRHCGLRSVTQSTG